MTSASLTSSIQSAARQPLILGSASIRRSFILTELGLEHEVIPSPYDEEGFEWSGDLMNSIQALARAKANPLAEIHPNRTLLTADTIVVWEGKRLGKPQDKAQARDYLRLLRGRHHEVYTALCVHQNSSWNSALGQSRVLMASLTDDEIESYISTRVPYDKAGGYAIQGIGGLLVERLEGCFYNVMGLPVALAHQLLKPLGYDLWKSACEHSS